MNKRIMDCPIEYTLSVIGGKWKVIILWYLKEEKILRYGELKKKLPEITQKMLTQQLRELEKDEIIKRKVYKVVPPKVEYSLTKKGHTLDIAVKLFHEWGQKYMN